MSHRNGTGLHPYWYIRVITLLITVFLPIGLEMYLEDYHPEILLKFMNKWVVLAWFLFMVLAMIISLKIESILEKKKDNKTTVISNVQLSDEQKQALNQTFEQFDNIFGNNAFANNNASKTIICPICHNSNVAKTQTGKYICLTCENKFHID